MWKFKSCPRCGGDLYIERDYHGWYEECLQCGYIGELKDIAEFKKELVEKKRELVQAARTPS